MGSPKFTESPCLDCQHRAQDEICGELCNPGNEWKYFLVEDGTLNVAELEAFDTPPPLPEGMPALDTNQDVPPQRAISTIKPSDLGSIADIINQVEDMKQRSVAIPVELLDALKKLDLDTDKYYFDIALQDDVNMGYSDYIAIIRIKATLKRKECQVNLNGLSSFLIIGDKSIQVPAESLESLRDELNRRLPVK